MVKVAPSSKRARPWTGLPCQETGEGSWDRQLRVTPESLLSMIAVLTLLDRFLQGAALVMLKGATRTSSRILEQQE
jgi:hypothetical protein